MTTLETLLRDPDMAGVWNLAPDRSAITFKIRNMWGLLNVKGRFTDGEAWLNREDCRPNWFKYVGNEWATTDQKAAS